MPEINKNYNEQEHILLCANGQKEYCHKNNSIGYLNFYDFPTTLKHQVWAGA